MTPPDDQNSHYWNAIEPIWDRVNIYDGPEQFLSTFRSIRPELGFLYAAHFCQSEVRNGGFRQFFSNSTGVLAPEAIEGLRAIGLSALAEVVAEAVAIFDLPYPRDRETRDGVLSKLPKDTFESLDTRFFQLVGAEHGGFERAATGYASKVAA